MAISILVLYYSQSGQLGQILDNLTSTLGDKLEITTIEYKPVEEFSFPWTSQTFFDAMPESVLEIPVPLQPIEVPQKPYDLVILGYQPWFLSPSIPTSSFLQSDFAKVLDGKPVLTVLGTRNMWLNAQEKVKARLLALNARLVGSIVLADTNHNLISLLTIIRWNFTGRKEASKWLPEAGVQTADIKNAARFGSIIRNAVESGNWEGLQPALLAAGAVELKPTLIILEKRGIKQFRKFARYIREKGERGNPDRLPRVLLFKRLLLTGIFVLSPISGFTAKMASLFRQKSFRKQVNYLKELTMRRI
ncbi:hypothetical protein [Flavihumibacter sp. CACIAM 22H1]|uniref:hypothetical protein n=1 Tax=Flavihumibacter sp. CACIAM 22H1 TaxID=1812911 RepID=UPI0007A918D4|nr:hypothetical protein [Flavihumibacter sp. CACIAM 22H1]KYP13978.1 MAG: hypothetical protein A1D16_16250 [Flavihumibacter sp. CACIAM 22H1]